MVPEQRIKTCTYTVCQMVPETQTKTCTYRSATWCRSTRTRTCTYQVCRMVPEAADQELHGLPHGAGDADQDLHVPGVPMVPEAEDQDLHVQGLPDGAGAEGEDLHVSGLPHGSGAEGEDLHLSGLPDGSGAEGEDLHVSGLPHGAGEKTKTCTYQVCRMVQECKSVEVPYKCLPPGSGEVREASAVHDLQAGALHEDRPGQALCAAAGRLHGHALRAESCLQASAGASVLPGPLLRAELLWRLTRPRPRGAAEGFTAPAARRHARSPRRARQRVAR